MCWGGIHDSGKAAGLEQLEDVTGIKAVDTGTTLGRMARVSAGSTRWVSNAGGLELLDHKTRARWGIESDGGRTAVEAAQPVAQAKPGGGTDLAEPAVITLMSRQGKVTLRYLGQLRHLYVGYKHKGRQVTLFVAGSHVRVIAEDGSVLRELSLDPNRNYQPLAELTGSTIS